MDKMTTRHRGAKLDAFDIWDFFSVTVIDASNDFIWFALLFSFLGKNHMDLWSSQKAEMLFMDIYLVLSSYR